MNINTENIDFEYDKQYKELLRLQTNNKIVYKETDYVEEFKGIKIGDIILLNMYYSKTSEPIYCLVKAIKSFGLIGIEFVGRLNNYGHSLSIDYYIDGKTGNRIPIQIRLTNNNGYWINIGDIKENLGQLISFEKNDLVKCMKCFKEYEYDESYGKNCKYCGFYNIVKIEDV